MARRRKPSQSVPLGPPPGLSGGGVPPQPQPQGEAPPPRAPPRVEPLRPAAAHHRPAAHHPHPHPRHGRAILAACALVWALALAGGTFMAASPRFDTGRHAAPGGLLLRFDAALRAAGPALALPALAARALAGALRGGRADRGRPPSSVASHHHALGATAVYVAASAARAGLYLPHREGLLGAAVEGLRAVGASPGAAARAAVHGLRSAAAVAAGSHPATTWERAARAVRGAAAAARDASKRHAGVHLMSDHLLLGALLAALLAGEAAVLGAEVLHARRRRGGPAPTGGRAHALAVHAGLALAVILFFVLAADMAVTAAHFHPVKETMAAAGLGALVFQAPVAAWVVRTWPTSGGGGGGGGGGRRRWRTRKKKAGGGGGGGE